VIQWGIACKVACKAWVSIQFQVEAANAACRNLIGLQVNLWGCTPIAQRIDKARNKPTLLLDFNWFIEKIGVHISSSKTILTSTLIPQIFQVIQQIVVFSYKLLKIIPVLSRYLLLTSKSTSRLIWDSRLLSFMFISPLMRPGCNFGL